MTKTAWTEHVKACKGLGLTREEIRQWYWAEKEAREAEAVKESSDEEDESDEETQIQLAIGLSLEDGCAMASKEPVRKASKPQEGLIKSPKELLTRRQAQALLEKSAKDFIQNRNVSVPFSKIRRPAFHRP